MWVSGGLLFGFVDKCLFFKCKPLNALMSMECLVVASTQLSGSRSEACVREGPTLPVSGLEGSTAGSAGGRSLLRRFSVHTVQCPSETRLLSCSDR